MKDVSRRISIEEAHSHDLVLRAASSFATNLPPRGALLIQAMRDRSSRPFAARVSRLAPTRGVTTFLGSAIVMLQRNQRVQMKVS